MEDKITPKSCSKLLLWLQSQVQETKLFCDGQMKAQDEGEMGPAYSKGEGLLALPTARVTLVQLSGSSFCRDAQPAVFPLVSNVLPPISCRMDTRQTSLEAFKRMPLPIGT